MTNIPSPQTLDPAPGLNSVFMDLYEQPGYLFRRAQQISVSIFYEILGDEVTPIQYAILRMLHERPGTDQKTLAGLVALDTSSTATTAERLEAKGLIVRELHIAGRRQRLLFLTPEGQRLLSSMVDGVRKMQDEMFRNFQPEERATLMRLMHEFVSVNNARSRAPLETSGSVDAPPTKARRKGPAGRRR
ncbi:DNA-binding MarR family transcriptional regulator [Paraburkholderia sp. EB58]|jgi:DNA-binding MarR family transcriptional regulator|uniref:MarR family winged helix-turn-helix transcriptional regulator n=1 Tax=unclassified Paraburkholderia TaxID=2615204 RepID=UPI003C7DC053